MVKQISDNEIHLFIKYIKSVLWRVGERLSYIEDALCLKVNSDSKTHTHIQREFPAFLQPESSQDTNNGPFPEPALPLFNYFSVILHSVPDFETIMDPMALPIILLY